MNLLVKWLQGVASVGDTLQKTAHSYEQKCKAVVRVLEGTLGSDGDLQGKDNIAYVCPGHFLLTGTPFSYV